MNKSEVFVKVENKKQAEQFKAVLKALGEIICDGYWVDECMYKQDKLVFGSKGWTVVGYDARNRTEITIKELIKILVSEEK